MTRPVPSTLSIRVPFAVRKRGGRKLVITPDGTAARLKEHLDIQDPEAKAEADRWIYRLESQPEGSPADADEWLPEALRRLHETGDWADAPELLRRVFSTHPPHPSAIILAEAIADLDGWELLNGWIQNILEIDTPAAVRLAAFAASRQGDSAQVLTIIDDNAASFGEALPPDLRRLRADALLRAGQVTAAVQEVNQIVAATSLPEDRLLRAEILVSIGDLRSGAGAVREALREDRLPPDRALKWAYLLHDEDPELARQLWRTAVSGGIEEGLVVAAMHQAFQLGLDDEVGQLMPMVQARAASGAPEIRMLDLNEAVEIITRQREADETIENSYLDGAIPVHLYVRSRLGALAHLYLGTRQGEAGQLFVRLIRHGSRARNLEFGPWQNWHIHLDVTGFLESSRIGLLDELERHPNPIRVSPRLPLLLVEMQKAVRTAQPSVIEAKRRLLHGLNDRAISERDAAPEGSIIIGLTPEEGRSDIVSLVGALRTAGYIAPAEADERLRALGGGAPEEDLVLAPGMALHFDADALEQAAAVGLLNTLTPSFAVSVEAGFGEQARRVLAADQEERRMADVLGALRERLSDGIQSGRYQLLEPNQADGHSGEDLLLASLRDILNAPAVENGVAWIDDRFLTSYERTATMPVLGVVEALHAMRGAGIVDQAELSRRIGDLRESGALFIPFNPEEVAGPLLQTPVVGGWIVESEQLRTLRRSIAAAARLERHLKLGEATGTRADRPDEMEYPRSVMRLLSDVLEYIWNEAGQSDDDLFARSDWLWANARSTQTTRDWPATDPETTQEAFETMQIAFCLDKAIDIGGLNDEQKQHRLTFLHWVWERIVRPKIDTDPTFLTRLADFIARFYAALLEPREGSRNRREHKFLQQLVLLRVDRLPKPVRDLVAARPEFRAYFKTVQRVSIGRSRFDQPRFWRAIRTALRYGKSRLRDMNGRRVQMRRDGDDILLSGGIQARLHDPIAAVVAARPRDLSTALERMIRIFDVDEETTKALKSEDLGKLEPHVLAARLEAERARSSAHKLKRIEDNLRQRRSFAGDIFEPGDIGPFLSYLGMAKNAAVPDLVGAFAILSDRHTPQEAFCRLSGIPVAPAGGFYSGAENLEAFASLARTPISLVHVAVIARRERREDLALEIVDRLVRMISVYGDMFVTILRWTEKVFHRDAGWRALSHSLRLACVWAYADRLTSIFISAGSSPDHAKAFFQGHWPAVSAPDVVEMRRHVLDQAAPQLLSAPALLFHCLGAIFGSDRLDERLPEELAARVRELLIARADALVLPHVTLMVRRTENPDAMGSFMRVTPTGLLPDELDPATTRQSLIDGGLMSLESGGGDTAAIWDQLAAFASGGLSLAEQRRYMALLRQADLWSLGLDDQQPNFFRWRALLAPAAMADPDWAASQLVDLASACRTNLYLQDGELTPEALGEIVETAAIVAAAFQSGDGRVTFEGLLRRIAFAWPESVPTLRTIVDNLLSVTPATRSRQLWDLYLLLRTFR